MNPDHIMRQGPTKGALEFLFYYWAYSLPLRVFCFPSETSLEETKFSLQVGIYWRKLLA